MRTPIRVALVGLGERGTRLARTFDELPGPDSLALRPEPGCPHGTRTRFPSASWTASFGDILTDDGVDAVVIATPASNRFDLALRALEADKHVFVEQPIALGGEEAQVLVDEAEARDRILAVRNAVLFQPAVRKLKELVVAGALGDVYYIHAEYGTGTAEFGRTKMRSGISVRRTSPFSSTCWTTSRSRSQPAASRTCAASCPMWCSPI